MKLFRSHRKQKLGLVAVLSAVMLVGVARAGGERLMLSCKTDSDIDGILHNACQVASQIGASGDFFERKKGSALLKLGSGGSGEPIKIQTDSTTDAPTTEQFAAKKVGNQVQLIDTAGRVVFKDYSAAAVSSLADKSDSIAVIGSTNGSPLSITTKPKSDMGSGDVLFVGNALDLSIDVSGRQGMDGGTADVAAGVALLKGELAVSGEDRDALAAAAIPASGLGTPRVSADQLNAANGECEFVGSGYRRAVFDNNGGFVVQVPVAKEMTVERNVCQRERTNELSVATNCVRAPEIKKTIDCKYPDLQKQVPAYRRQSENKLIQYTCGDISNAGGEWTTRCSSDEYSAVGSAFKLKAIALKPVSEIESAHSKKFWSHSVSGCSHPLFSNTYYMPWTDISNSSSPFSGLSPTSPSMSLLDQCSTPVHKLKALQDSGSLVVSRDSVLSEANVEYPGSDAEGVNSIGKLAYWAETETDPAKTPAENTATIQKRSLLDARRADAIPASLSELMKSGQSGVVSQLIGMGYEAPTIKDALLGYDSISANKMVGKFSLQLEICKGMLGKDFDDITNVSDELTKCKILMARPGESIYVIKETPAPEGEPGVLYEIPRASKEISGTRVAKSIIAILPDDTILSSIDNSMTSPDPVTGPLRFMMQKGINKTHASASDVDYKFVNFQGMSGIIRNKHLKRLTLNDLIFKSPLTKESVLRKLNFQLQGSTAEDVVQTKFSQRIDYSFSNVKAGLSFVKKSKYSTAPLIEPENVSQTRALSTSIVRIPYTAYFIPGGQFAAPVAKFSYCSTINLATDNVLMGGEDTFNPEFNRSLIGPEMYSGYKINLHSFNGGGGWDANRSPSMNSGDPLATAEIFPYSNAMMNVETIDLTANGRCKGVSTFDHQMNAAVKKIYDKVQNKSAVYISIKNDSDSKIVVSMFYNPILRSTSGLTSLADSALPGSYLPKVEQGPVKLSLNNPNYFGANWQILADASNPYGSAITTGSSTQTKDNGKFYLLTWPNYPFIPTNSYNSIESMQHSNAKDTQAKLVLDTTASIQYLALPSNSSVEKNALFPMKGFKASLTIDGRTDEEGIRNPFTAPTQRKDIPRFAKILKELVLSTTDNVSPGSSTVNRDNEPNYNDNVRLIDSMAVQQGGAPLPQVDCTELNNAFTFPNKLLSKGVRRLGQKTNNFFVNDFVQNITGETLPLDGSDADANWVSDPELSANDSASFDYLTLMPRGETGSKLGAFADRENRTNYDNRQLFFTRAYIPYSMSLVGESYADRYMFLDEPINMAQSKNSFSAQIQRNLNVELNSADRPIAPVEFYDDADMMLMPLLGPYNGSASLKLSLNQFFETGKRKIMMPVDKEMVNQPIQFSILYDLRNSRYPMNSFNGVRPYSEFWGNSLRYDNDSWDYTQGNNVRREYCEPYSSTLTSITSRTQKWTGAPFNCPQNVFFDKGFFSPFLHTEKALFPISDGSRMLDPKAVGLHYDYDATLMRNMEGYLASSPAQKMQEGDVNLLSGTGLNLLGSAAQYGALYIAGDNYNPTSFNLPPIGIRNPFFKLGRFIDALGSTDTNRGSGDCSFIICGGQQEEPTSITYQTKAVYHLFYPKLDGLTLNVDASNCAFDGPNPRFCKYTRSPLVNDDYTNRGWVPLLGATNYESVFDQDRGAGNNKLALTLMKMSGSVMETCRIKIQGSYPAPSDIAPSFAQKLMKGPFGNSSDGPNFTSYNLPYGLNVNEVGMYLGPLYGRLLSAYPSKLGSYRNTEFSNIFSIYRIMASEAETSEPDAATVNSRFNLVRGLSLSGTYDNPIASLMTSKEMDEKTFLALSRSNSDRGESTYKTTVSTDPIKFLWNGSPVQDRLVTMGRIMEEAKVLKEKMLPLATPGTNYFEDPIVFMPELFLGYAVHSAIHAQTAGSSSQSFSTNPSLTTNNVLSDFNSVFQDILPYKTFAILSSSDISLNSFVSPVNSSVLMPAIMIGDGTKNLGSLKIAWSMENTSLFVDLVSSALLTQEYSGAFGSISAIRAGIAMELPKASNSGSFEVVGALSDALTIPGSDGNYVVKRGDAFDISAVTTKARNTVTGMRFQLAPYSARVPGLNVAYKADGISDEGAFKLTPNFDRPTNKTNPWMFSKLYCSASGRKLLRLEGMETSYFTNAQGEKVWPFASMCKFGAQQGPLELDSVGAPKALAPLSDNGYSSCTNLLECNEKSPATKNFYANTVSYENFTEVTGINRLSPPSCPSGTRKVSQVWADNSGLAANTVSYDLRSVGFDAVSMTCPTGKEVISEIRTEIFKHEDLCYNLKGQTITDGRALKSESLCQAGSVGHPEDAFYPTVVYGLADSGWRVPGDTTFNGVGGAPAKETGDPFANNSFTYMKIVSGQSLIDYFNPALVTAERQAAMIDQWVKEASAPNFGSSSVCPVLDVDKVSGVAMVADTTASTPGGYVRVSPSSTDLITDQRYGSIDPFYIQTPYRQARVLSGGQMQTVSYACSSLSTLDPTKLTLKSREVSVVTQNALLSDFNLSEFTDAASYVYTQGRADVVLEQKTPFSSERTDLVTGEAPACSIFNNDNLTASLSLQTQRSGEATVSINTLADGDTFNINEGPDAVSFKLMPSSSLDSSKNTSAGAMDSFAWGGRWSLVGTERVTLTRANSTVTALCAFDAQGNQVLSSTCGSQVSITQDSTEGFQMAVRALPGENGGNAGTATILTTRKPERLDVLGEAGRGGAAGRTDFGTINASNRGMVCYKTSAEADSLTPWLKLVKFNRNIVTVAPSEAGRDGNKPDENKKAYWGIMPRAIQYIQNQIESHFKSSP